MNRTFKFRLWYYGQKKFDYGDLQMFSRCSFPLDWCEIQQFTGLEDSDGVDIYEGDIVQGLFLDTDNHHWKEATAPVVWNDNTCGFNISTNTWDRLTIKVVGNIFENE